MRFHFGKLFRTVRICGCILMARTFGYYVHSGFDGVNEYAQYRWRGREWRIPTFHFNPYL